MRYNIYIPFIVFFLILGVNFFGNITQQNNTRNTLPDIGNIIQDETDSNEVIKNEYEIDVKRIYDKKNQYLVYENISNDILISINLERFIEICIEEIIQTLRVTTDELRVEFTSISDLQILVEVNTPNHHSKFLIGFKQNT